MENHSHEEFHIRKATMRDAPAMHRMINALADKGDMLPRALSEIYENLRDFYVVEHNTQVVACCALHICWEDLAEVRSLAVETDYRGQGLGRTLVDTCRDEARQLGLGKLFTLTLQPSFFESCGFQRVDVSMLPRKIWGECFRCPKFPNCDEVALICEIETACRPASEAAAATVE